MNLTKRESALPFKDFVAAHNVFSLLEMDLQNGIYSQFSSYFRRTFLHGMTIHNVRMFDYPDILSGVMYCKSLNKVDLWAFGLIVGATGKDTDLAMIACCGGKGSTDMINIVRPFDLVDSRVRYRGVPTFVRVTEALEEEAPIAEEIAAWQRSFAL